MTNDEAGAYIEARVPRETFAKIVAFAGVVTVAASKQNLIAASTIETIWMRHILDSFQLLSLAPPGGRWADLGAGAGFPGMIVGIVGQHDVMLVESRAKRVAFLKDAIASLGLPNVTVHQGRVELLDETPFDVISARAFAPLPRLLETATHLASAETRWILPKGQGAQAELEAIAGTWQGDFRTVASMTDPEAAIILATGVSKRPGKRKGQNRR